MDKLQTFIFDRRHLLVPFLIVFLLFFLSTFFSQSGQGFKSSEYSFYSLSPSGEFGGRSIPASCPSNNHDDSTYGQTCQSAPNSCGARGSGTYQCGGICNASVPQVPSDLGQSCTVSNACGTLAAGTRQCNGSCSATMPALPNGYGQYCQTEANNCGVFGQGYIGCNGVCGAFRPADDSDCSTTEIEIGLVETTTDPPGCDLGGGSDCEVVRTIIPRDSQMVAPGSSCSISWDASPATRCTIVGPGINRQNEPASGTFSTPRIGVDTAGSASYTITCYNGNTVAASRLFSCRLNPSFQET